MTTEQRRLTKAELLSYDHVVIAFSGGKDSVACFLDLLDRGVPKDRIELWHHDIDGTVDGSGKNFMDWPCTCDYCRVFAEAFNCKLYYSWKVGGFSREMLRENQRTAPTRFETPDGETRQVGGIRGKLGTRRKFPQVSADLSVRWCSAYLKVDVCSTAIANQVRFQNKKTLLVSGERAQESTARAHYKIFEPDRSDNRNGKRVVRHVDRYRPVHAWDESAVWSIIERHLIRVHPAYRIGWGRVSCAACIFGSANQWASLFHINPDQVKTIIGYEKEFGVTINRKKSVEELIKTGEPYTMADLEAIRESMKSDYHNPIFLTDWQLPAGAYGESCGPT